MIRKQMNIKLYIHTYKQGFAARGFEIQIFASIEIIFMCCFFSILKFWNPHNLFEVWTLMSDRKKKFALFNPDMFILKCDLRVLGISPKNGPVWKIIKYGNNLAKNEVRLAFNTSTHISGVSGTRSATIRYILWVV